MNEKLLLEELTWPEIKACMEKGMRTVVIFAASIEQHGPHLAEVTDTALGYLEALDLAERLGNALVAPVIRPGLSAHHMVLPGTITLRPEVFTGIVEDYITSYARHGFTTMILCASHGGDYKAMADIAEAQSRVHPELRIVTGYSLDELDAGLAELERSEGLERGTCGGHACDYETSVMLKYFSSAVRMDRLQRGFVGEISPEVLKSFFEKGVKSVSEIGVMGDPSHADAERGARYFKKMQDLQEKAVRRNLKAWDEQNHKD